MRLSSSGSGGGSTSSGNASFWKVTVLDLGFLHVSSASVSSGVAEHEVIVEWFLDASTVEEHEVCLSWSLLASTVVEHEVDLL